MTEHNHTPSTKAGQLSRHSCNQILRGRYQQTNQTGPEHQKGRTAGEGESTRDRERSQPKTNNKTEPAGHTQARRGRSRTRKTTRRTDRAPDTKNKTIPRAQRATHQGDHKPPKEQRAAQTMNLKKVVLLTLVKDGLQFSIIAQGKGACKRTKRADST